MGTQRVIAQQSVGERHTPSQASPVLAALTQVNVAPGAGLVERAVHALAAIEVPLISRHHLADADGGWGR